MDDATTESTATDDTSGEIVARAGRYYRWTRYLISVGLLIGYGGFFFRDGFVIWPEQLHRAQELEAVRSHAEVQPHTETDIRLQKVLGVSMPILGVVMLAWTLYNSRGKYRLAGNTLYVPGHPPVPLESILSIDKTLWDRKGIAYIEYALGDPGGGGDPPATRKLKMDDFVYERGPTDAIVERVEKFIAPEGDEHVVNDPAVETLPSEETAVSGEQSADDEAGAN